MRNFETKIDSPGIGDNNFSAVEFNNLSSELENAITSTGIALNTESTTQLALAMSRYSQGADYFNDSGVPNSYILTKTSSFPPSTSYFIGMSVGFVANSTSTASSTINVDSIGSVPVKNEYGANLTNGDITKGNFIQLIYDGTNFKIKSRGIVHPWKAENSHNNFTTISNAANPNTTIDIGKGCMTAINGQSLIYTDTTISKRLDASWTAGSGNGGLFTGSDSNVGDVTYHLFAIKQDSTGDVDFGFDSDLNAIHRPAGYTFYKRIASIKTDASGNIPKYYQYGRHFIFATPVQYSNTSFTTLAFNLNLDVPLGINVIASLYAAFVTASAGTTTVYISSPVSNNIIPGIATGQGMTLLGGINNGASDHSNNTDVLVGTSGNVRVRSSKAYGSALGEIGGGLFFNLKSYQDIL